MRDGLKLYLRYVGVSLRSQLQYPASFVMMILGNLVTTVIDFLGILALFSRFGSLGEWTLPQVAVFYGMVHVAFALAEAGARGFDILHRHVRAGTFDRMLLRPRSTVLQVIGLEFQLMRIGRFTQGLIVLGWGMANLELTLTLAQILLVIASIAGGAFLFSGLFVLQATLSFWSVESLEVVNLTTYGGVQTAQMPITIYQKWFRRFFTWIIPLAAINYFPLMAILDHPAGGEFPVWVSWVSPVVGPVFFLLCLQVWNFGVRHYHSTGS
ncbi:MAG: ABC transporter permease [Firmicutes bacterium]|nr:ABC transporter permease [Bacillota bacterium]